MIAAEREGLGPIFNCASTDAIGSPVRISGINTVTAADASNLDRSFVIGYIGYKPTPTTCYIVKDYYYSAASGFSGFSGAYGQNGVGSPVYLTNSSGFSGLPGGANRLLGTSLSPREALLRADPLSSNHNNQVFRNKIINGAMDLWQRGTSFTSLTASAGYNTVAADRFRFQGGTAGSTAVFSYAQDSSVPSLAQSGRVFNYSLRLTCTTADTAMAANDFNTIYYGVEGYDWATLAQKPCILSFWVRARQTGTFSFAIRNSGSDRTYVTDYGINTSDTWEYKVINIPASPSSGTWNYTNGLGALLLWSMGAGSASTTTVGNMNTWASTNLWSSPNCSLLSASSSPANTFYMTGVQLEAGYTPTQFETRPLQQELSLCQRYYEKSYAYAQAPASTVTAGLHFSQVGTTWAAALGSPNVLFRTEKRTATPTITVRPYTTHTNTSRVSDGSTGTDLAANSGTPIYPSERGFIIQNGTGGSLSPTGGLVIFHWESDAEL